NATRRAGRASIVSPASRSDRRRPTARQDDFLRVAGCALYRAQLIAEATRSWLDAEAAQPAVTAYVADNSAPTTTAEASRPTPRVCRHPASQRDASRRTRVHRLASKPQ
ncbi:hypothetical protein KDW39_08155, partial [Burkholderia multivorans]|nr:hypothetical protein [Burkholderia multivorans]MBU9600443.1 hypothetical protein [Burkholderia multivorans]